jgi:GNAT superfamily N-acetyltransferase
MIVVRDYREDDAERVGVLIADTYSEFNLAHLPAEERDKCLGPFLHAGSLKKKHREAIAQVIREEMVLVAEDDGEIVGVLRGRKERLASLFVRGDYHGRGIGRKLVERFEEQCVREGVLAIKVAATLFAVPFYLKIGYKRTTGIRPCWSFEGRGLVYQPMKKTFPKVTAQGKE